MPLLCPDRFLLVQMEEEEEERLRQPPIIQEPHPEEERERERERHGRSSRGQRGCRPESDQDRREARLRPGHQDAEVAEEGEEEEEHYGNDGESAEAKPRLKPTLRPISAAVAAAPSASSASGNVSPNTPSDESPCGIIIPHENSPPDALPQDENRPRIGLSLKLGESMSRTKWLLKKKYNLNSHRFGFK